MIAVSILNSSTAAEEDAPVRIDLAATSVPLKRALYTVPEAPLPILSNNLISVLEISDLCLLEMS